MPPRRTMKVLLGRQIDHSVLQVASKEIGFMTIAIVVHGGAGAWSKAEERLDEAMAACREAAAAGHAILVAGGSALDAVEAAVHILEDCPVMDAGRGSYPNRNGDIEMDALIMDGRTLNLGAIAAIQRVRHPVTLARRVMDHSGHQFLVGAGADAFADGIGFPRCDVDELRVDVPSGDPGPIGDTVGAVALDIAGNIAAATSTGGIANKLPGRVGDSPLVGSGAYADNESAGVSATGHGEMLMRVLISKQVCDFVSMGLSAGSACEGAMRLLEERTGGQGGLIAVDKRGGIGVAYNTQHMPHASVIDDGEIIAGF